MKIKIKKLHPEAKIPQYMTNGAIAVDLYAVSAETKQLRTGPVIEYGTGLAVEVPEGYGCFVVPRSSLTSNTTLMLGNSFGVIDQDYRGEVKLQYRHIIAGQTITAYKIGERIGQMLFMPIVKPELVEVSELSDTKRGSGGFGSTGK